MAAATIFTLNSPLTTADASVNATSEQYGAIKVRNHKEDEADPLFWFEGDVGLLGFAIQVDDDWFITQMECP